MIAESGVKRAILTHISRRYPDAEALKKLIEKYENIELAEDFMKVVI